MDVCSRLKLQGPGRELIISDAHGIAISAMQMTLSYRLPCIEAISKKFNTNSPCSFGTNSSSSLGPATACYATHRIWIFHRDSQGNMHSQIWTRAIVSNVELTWEYQLGEFCSNQTKAVCLYQVLTSYPGSPPPFFYMGRSLGTRLIKFTFHYGP